MIPNASPPTDTVIEDSPTTAVDDGSQRRYVERGFAEPPETAADVGAQHNPPWIGGTAIMLLRLLPILRNVKMKSGPIDSDGA
jgi:hypothetical protein